MPTATASKAGKSKRNKQSNFITAGQAWEALGADEKYAPRHPEDAASNRMLWALNNKGLLKIRES